VPEISSVLYSTREALLHKGRKHFEALNTKALITEIPMRIEVKGLGHCTTAEAMELDILYPALQIILQRFYLNYANYSFSM
jgi:hypothetical protein